MRGARSRTRGHARAEYESARAVRSGNCRSAPSERALEAAEDFDAAACVADGEGEVAVLRRDDRRRRIRLLHAEDDTGRMTRALERGQVVDMHVVGVRVGVLEVHLRRVALDDLDAEAAQSKIGVEEERVVD